MRTSILMATTALLLAGGAHAQSPQPVAAPAPSIVLVPKFLGSDFRGPDRISRLFDQAHAGAAEAAQALHNPTPLQDGGVTRGQIESVTDATAAGANAIVISNNSGDQIVPALKAAHDKGIKVVAWDGPIPPTDAVDVFVSQVDFTTSGRVLADMALDIIGPGGGKFAILVNAPDGPGPAAWATAFQDLVKQDPKYAALVEVERVSGTNDPEASYRQARALLDKHRDLTLIMAPDSTSILAAAKAVRDAQRGERVKVGGFGLPSELHPYVVSGVVPKFALWSFVDFGYLAYQTAYLLATDAIKAEDGQRFTAGRLGPYTITQDPARANGLRVVLGPWTVYDKTTIDVAAR